MNPDITFDDADLNAFVDGRIEPSRAAALSESLASDREARARIDLWKRQNESLRTMFASVLFEPVPIRLMPTAVAAASQPAIPADKRDATPFPGRLAGVVATTAIGMALIGFAIGALTSSATNGFGLMPTVLRPETPDPSRMDDAARRALENYRTYLEDPIHPVEMAAADAPRLQRWIQRKLGGSFRIPDLQDQGWTLIGGRVVPASLGAGAFLVYGNGPDRLGLSVSRRPTPVDGGADQASSGEAAGIGVVDWTADGLAFALTSGLGRAWLERNGTNLRSSVMSRLRSDITAP